jgi:hypothetical protein
MLSLNDTTVVANLKQSVAFFLDKAGRDAQAAEQQIDQFLDQIKPDLYQLLVETAAGQPGTADAVELFADATVSRAARLALDFTVQEKLAIASVIAAGVRAVIGVALAAA